MKRPQIAALLALVLPVAALQAADKDSPALEAPQASIPFVNTGHSIRDWQADGEQGIWVQDARRQWYYAKLIGPCLGLDFAIRVGFEARGTDRLDRFSMLIVPGYGRCAIQSFTKSEAPPDANRRPKPEGSLELKPGAPEPAGKE